MSMLNRARTATAPLFAILFILGAAPQAQAERAAEAITSDPASLRFSAADTYAQNTAATNLANDTRQPTTTHHISAMDPIDEAKNAPPSGVYFRISGLYVDPQNDPVFRDGSGTLGTDVGAGLTLGIGFKDLNRPVSYELEYAYRSFNTDTYTDAVTGFVGDTKVSMHTLAANILFDQPDIVGPVGLYAGLGVGFRISDFRFSSSGGSSETEINGDGFFWQAMAGVTFSVNSDFQIYGGVRWADAGTVDDLTLSIDTTTLNFELGVRIYF